MKKIIRITTAAGLGLLALAISPARSEEPEPPPESTVSVAIASVDHNPACLHCMLRADATAAFTAAGGAMEQLQSGWTTQFRWKWQFLTDGAVGEASPAPQTTGWSEWTTTAASWARGSFQGHGAREVRATVQVRLVKDGQTDGTIYEGVASQTVTVINLQDATNFRVLASGNEQMTIAWDPSPSPNVAGYKYHIEPDKSTLVDVGNVTQCTITGLTNGKAYIIGIHTYDIYGNMTHTLLGIGLVVDQDTDGDGLSDSVETENNLDPNDAGSDCGGWWACLSFHVGRWTPPNEQRFMYFGTSTDGPSPSYNWQLDSSATPVFTVGDFVLPYAEAMVNHVVQMERSPTTATTPAEEISFDLIGEVYETTCLYMPMAGGCEFVPFGEGAALSPPLDLGWTVWSHMNTYVGTNPGTATGAVWETGFEDFAESCGIPLIREALSPSGMGFVWFPQHYGILQALPWEPGETSTYDPHELKLVDSGVYYYLTSAKTDLDMVVTGNTSGPCENQAAPLFARRPLAAATETLTLTFGGGTPAVSRTVRVESTNPGAVRFKNGTASGPGTVLNDGARVEWDSVGPPLATETLTVQYERGDSPDGGGAWIVASVNSILDGNDSALHKAFFPPGTKDLWTDQTIPNTIFVPVEGSFEAINVPSIDIEGFRHAGTDGQGDPQWAALAEAHEDTPGLFVGVNDDDNDGVTGVDNADTVLGNDMGDLVRIVLHMPQPAESPEENDEDVASWAFETLKDANSNSPSHLPPLEVPSLTLPPGRIRITTTPPLTDQASPIRIFAGDGGGGWILLTDMEVDMASPAGQLAPLVNNGTLSLLVEGLSTTGAATIKLSYEVGDPATGYTELASDTLRVAPVEVDLGVDLDGIGGITAADDAIEDIPGTPGRILLANTLDSTGNNVPDYADGIDRHGNSAPSRSTQFVPLELSIPPTVNPAIASVRFTYSASDPATVVRNELGPDEPSYPRVSYSPGSTEFLRIWRKDGPDARKCTPVAVGTGAGDYIGASMVVPLAALMSAGPTATLYLEGVNQSDPDAARIIVELDPYGGSDFLCDDAIRCTVAGIRIVYTDVTGLHGFGNTPSDRVQRIPSDVEPDGIACDRSLGAPESARLLLRVTGSPALWDSAASTPSFPLGFGYIDKTASPACFSALPAAKEGVLQPLTANDNTALVQLGIELPGTALGGRNHIVLDARVYQPPLEFDTTDINNTDKERQLSLAVQVSGGVNGHGAKPYAVTLVRAPLLHVHGINSSYHAFFEESGWTDKFSSDFGFECFGADHSGTLQGNGDIHDVYAAVRDGITAAKAAIRNTTKRYEYKRIAVQRCDIVAHSYGGILTRWYTEQATWTENVSGTQITVDYGDRQDVRKVITLGTPHRGAPITNILCETYGNRTFFEADTGIIGWQLGWTLNLIDSTGQVKWHEGGAPPSGTAAQQAHIVDSLEVLSFGSEVLDQLNGNPFRDDIAYGAIVGVDEQMEFLDVPLVAANAHVFLEPHFDGDQVHSSCSDVSYFPWLSLLDGGNAKSDGIVPTWSQELPACSETKFADHIEYDTDSGTRSKVREWLNDISLPLGSAHRPVFQFPFIANNQSRHNAYRGSVLAGSGRSRNAGVVPFAIVQATIVPDPAADFTDGTGTAPPTLGGGGGGLALHCTGMVDRTGCLLSARVFQLTNLANGIAAPPWTGSLTGVLTPFSLTTVPCFGRLEDGGIVGPDGQDTTQAYGGLPASGPPFDSWHVGYEITAGGSGVNVQSPPAIVGFPSFILPAPVGPALVPSFPGHGDFSVRGGVPCSGTPGGTQALTVTLWDIDWGPDDILASGSIAIDVPSWAFPNLLIPYQHSSIQLFGDADGHVAGLLGTSGESSAEVYQDAGTTVPAATCQVLASP